MGARATGRAVFNLEEAALPASERSGFPLLVKHRLVSDTLHVHAFELHRHRLALEGLALFDRLLVGRVAGIPTYGMSSPVHG